METKMIVNSIESKYILAHRCPPPPLGNGDQRQGAPIIFKLCFSDFFRVRSSIGEGCAISIGGL
jgi:hypothetical protein